MQKRFLLKYFVRPPKNNLIEGFLFANSNKDSQKAIELFSLACSVVEQESKKSPHSYFVVPQGFFFCWLNNKLNQMQFDDLILFTRPSKLQSHWSPAVKQMYNKLHHGNHNPFLAAMVCVLKYHQDFQLTKLDEIVRVIAAVAQTIRPTKGVGELYSTNNLILAKKNLQFARERILRSENVPVHNFTVSNASTSKQIKTGSSFDLTVYSKREDELGAFMSFDPIRCWHASYIGPKSAQKLENQDATYGLTNNSSLIFALSDGVSTSIGGRPAAAVIVREFCMALASLPTDNNTPEKILLCAAEKTQDRIEELFEAFSNDPGSAQFAELRGPHQLLAIKRVLENTRNPKQSRIGPVLAATLLGGFLRYNKKQQCFEAHILRLGDGVIEHRNIKGEVTSYFHTDDEEMGISTVLCPGPLGKESLKRIEIKNSIQIYPNDSLLISSDGLVRGHKLLVWKKLQEILGENKMRAIISSADDCKAYNLLKQLSDFSDKTAEETKNNYLFGDNLSLILLNWLRN